MNLVAVAVTGLVAGGVSCAAVQGGLLAGVITRQRASVTSTIGSAPAPTVVDDLAPVGGFLAGKLVSHTVLGALLGVLGNAVQLTVGTRAVLQIVAGVLIVVFGLAQLGLPGFRRVVIEPPRSWQRVVRGSARSRAATAPALLGLASVLVPCGVTLSIEALALASGSAFTGALIMAVFVLSTSPLFAVLGYLARKAATAWRGRLAMATGLVVVALGVYTLNGGLELTGSPLAASRAAAVLVGEQPADTNAAATDVSGRQVITIGAGSTAYTPGNVEVKSGVPTELVIQSRGAQGCIRAFVIPSLAIERTLPVSGETRIDLGVLEAGRVDYSCAMGMYTGVLTVI